MKRAFAIDCIATIIIMMWLYASSSKYFDFAGFQRAMHNQPFPDWLSDLLIVVLPPAEIITAILLLWEKTRGKGFMTTCIMMSGFTLYIVAILLHIFKRVPCSCGGIIRLLSWKQHLFFNLFFIALSILGFMLTGRNENLKNNRNHRSFKT